RRVSINLEDVSFFFVVLFLVVSLIPCYFPPDTNKNKVNNFVYLIFYLIKYYKSIKVDFSEEIGKGI
ncbi:TPA: hypothetical protein ACJP1A_001859, partial [Streptococcus pyogenes]